MQTHAAERDLRADRLLVMRFRRQNPWPPGMCGTTKPYIAKPSDKCVQSATLPSVRLLTAR